MNPPAVKQGKQFSYQYNQKEMSRERESNVGRIEVYCTC